MRSQNTAVFPSSSKEYRLWMVPCVAGMFYLPPFDVKMRMYEQLRERWGLVRTWIVRTELTRLRAKDKMWYLGTLWIDVTVCPAVEQPLLTCF